MTKYDLILRSSVAERAAVSWRFERGRKRWHDAMVIVVASLAAGLAAAGIAGLRGADIPFAAYLGLVGAVASQVVWMSRKGGGTASIWPGCQRQRFKGVPCPSPSARTGSPLLRCISHVRTSAQRSAWTA